MFIEHDADNVDVLKRKASALGDLPDRVCVTVSAEDCYTQIEAMLQRLEYCGKRIAPAFAFVDPYGFNVPGALLSRLLRAGRVELFVNVIWRELDMAISGELVNPGSRMSETLDLIFDGDRWRQIDPSRNFDERADQTIDLLKDVYGAEWVTSVRMLGKNNATRYILAHFTNHDGGRDLMKECVWKICPEGGFYARRSDNPNQTRLIVPEPDLAPLGRWLRSKLKNGPRRWSELTDALRSELWLNKHLSLVVREFRKDKRIVATAYKGRFSKKADPLLSLTEE